MDPIALAARVNFRLHGEDRFLIEMAARRQRLRLSEFVRRAALRAASSVIEPEEPPKAA